MGTCPVCVSTVVWIADARLEYASIARKPPWMLPDPLDSHPDAGIAKVAWPLAVAVGRIPVREWIGGIRSLPAICWSSITPPLRRFQVDGGKTSPTFGQR